MKKDIFFEVVVSALIGMIVGLLFMVYAYAGHGREREVTVYIIQSGIIGIIIGVISEYMIFPLIKNLNKKLMYLIIFIELGGLTILFSLLMGVRQWYFLVMMVAVVEVLGISFFNMQLKYKADLNSKLEERKNELLKKG